MELILVKTGYPPRSLTLVPELPVSSLGLVSGDQLIVTQRAGSSVATGSTTVSSNPGFSTQVSPSRTAQTSRPAAYSTPILTSQSPASEYAQTSDGGVLVHRVCFCGLRFILLLC